MLKIAICDDMDTELKRIAQLTNEYLSVHSLTAEVREFSHPDELLTVCEQESFQATPHKKECRKYRQVIKWEHE